MELWKIREVDMTEPRMVIARTIDEAIEKYREYILKNVSRKQPEIVEVERVDKYVIGHPQSGADRRSGPNHSG